MKQIIANYQSQIHQPPAGDGKHSVLLERKSSYDEEQLRQLDKSVGDGIVVADEARLALFQEQSILLDKQILMTPDPASSASQAKRGSSPQNSGRSSTLKLAQRQSSIHLIDDKTDANTQPKAAETIESP